MSKQGWAGQVEVTPELLRGLNLNEIKSLGKIALLEASEESKKIIAEKTLHGLNCMAQGKLCMCIVTEVDRQVDKGFTLDVILTALIAKLTMNTIEGFNGDGTVYVPKENDLNLDEFLK